MSTLLSSARDPRHTARLPLFRLAHLLSLMVLATALPAQPLILNDTFADGERRTQNLPASLAWHIGITRANALTVRNGALDLAFTGANFTIWSYFPQVSLNLGDSITLSIDLSATALPLADGGNAGLRFALCYTNGTTPLVADGAGPIGNFQGYAIQSTATSRRGVVLKRSGPAAHNGRLLASVAVTGDPATVVWPSLGTNQINGIAQTNTPYTVTLKITRTGTDSADITETISGGGLTTANTATVTDAASIFSRFDTIALWAPNDITGNILVTRVNLTTTTLAAITNLSILTQITAADPIFTVGAVIGGEGTRGNKALLVRAAGPSLAALGVGDTLTDSLLEVFSGPTVTASNDNWGGTTALATAFAQAGAFGYSSPTSLDAAVFNPALPPGGYTVQVSGVGGATGAVIAEIYDSTPLTEFVATTPRLVNVSVLKPITAGELLTAGFVISGSAPKQVLIRAVGPSLALAPFNVAGAMADPRLDLFSDQTVINSSDDWGGGTSLTAAFARVVAFPLPPASKDGALLVTLAPGNYSAQVSGVGGGGTVLIEIYEMP